MCTTAHLLRDRQPGVAVVVVLLHQARNGGHMNAPIQFRCSLQCPNKDGLDQRFRLLAQGEQAQVLACARPMSQTPGTVGGVLATSVVAFLPVPALYDSANSNRDQCETRQGT